MDRSSGPETCLLQVARDPSNNHVIDISGNSGYDASVLSWGYDNTYGDYLIFNQSAIQINNTNGNHDPRTILMFAKHTVTTDTSIILSYGVYANQIGTRFMYTYNGSQYSITDISPQDNTWYHVASIMTGNGYMIGNKMYIDGVNYPLSWFREQSELTGQAILENFIVLGGITTKNTYNLIGYESQIYYFDREL